MVKVDASHLNVNFDFAAYAEKVAKVNEMIAARTGAGNDYLGWYKYPETYNKAEAEEIKKYAKYVRENYEVLVVCGIGGSYLGARAAMEAINGLRQDKGLEIIFLGQTFSTDYVYDVLEYIKDKKFAINVISKSGSCNCKRW